MTIDHSQERETIDHSPWSVEKKKNSSGEESGDYGLRTMVYGPSTMDHGLCIEEYLQSLRLKNSSDETITRYQGILKALAEYLILKNKQLNSGSLHHYLNYLVNEYRKKDGAPLNNKTIALHICAIKSYCRYLHKQEYTLQNIARDIEPPRVSKNIVRYVPTEQEISQMLEKPKLDFWGMRDGAILELLYGTGLRNKEVRSLRLYDIDLEKQYVYLRDTKNKHDRIVPITRIAKEALSRYLALRVRQCAKAVDKKEREGRMTNCQSTNDKINLNSQKLNDKTNQEVFYSRSRLPMGKHSICSIIKKYRGDSSFTAHSLRHSCAIAMVRNHAPIMSVKELLGHKSLATTQIYTRVTINDLMSAHKKYHPRFFNRLNKNLLKNSG